MKKKNIAIIILILIIIGILAGIVIVKRVKKENREYKIEEISEYNYFVIKENNKYGVIDKQGNIIIEPNYDNIKIPNPNKAVFCCYEEEKIKILNDKSEEIFTQYESVEPLRLKSVLSDLMYEKSVLKYKENGKYGIIDFQGKKITKAMYDEIDTLQYKEGELIVKKDNKYGIINIKGTTLVKTNYDKIEADKYYSKDNGYKDSGYIVSNMTDEGYRYGYVNLNGKQLLDTKYNDLYRITEIDGNDIYLVFADNGKYGIQKNDKQIISNEYQEITYNGDNNVIVALKSKKYGVLSAQGNVIIPFEYSQIDITGKYIYARTNNEETKVFDIQGKSADIDKDTVIVKVKDTNYEIYIQNQDNKTKYSIYENNEKKTKNEYTYIEHLYDNYFLVSNSDSKLGIIDDNENNKLAFNYSSIQKIDNVDLIQATNSNNKKTEIYNKDLKKICELENATIENKNEYIKLSNNNETKYITKQGNEVKNTEIYIKNKIFAKKQGNLWGFVDVNGNKVVDYKYEKVTEENEYGYAGIKQNGKWGVINSDGKIIKDPTYELKDSPIFIGEYYQVVYGNGEIYYTK
mgnify:CR=1 FL=1